MPRGSDGAWGSACSCFALAGTPPVLIRAINAVVAQNMNTPEVPTPSPWKGSGAAPPTTPAAFKAKFDRDYAELEQTVKAANIQLQ